MEVVDGGGEKSRYSESLTVQNYPHLSTSCEGENEGE